MTWRGAQSLEHATRSKASNLNLDFISGAVGRLKNPSASGGQDVRLMILQNARKCSFFPCLGQNKKPYLSCGMADTKLPNPFKHLNHLSSQMTHRCHCLSAVDSHGSKEKLDGSPHILTKLLSPPQSRTRENLSGSTLHSLLLGCAKWWPGVI